MTTPNDQLKVWTILPFEAIGPLRLGSPRASIRKALGTRVKELANKRGPAPIDYFDSDAVRVEYSESGLSTYVEICSRKSVSVTYRETPLNGRRFEDVNKDLSALGHGFVQDANDPFGYFCLELGFVLNPSETEPALVSGVGLFSHGLYDFLKPQWKRIG